MIVHMYADSPVKDEYERGFIISHWVINEEKKKKE